MFWLFFSFALAQSDCVQTGEYRASRPTLSGDVETVDSEDGRFRVHFTREGDDKPGGGTGDDDVPLMVGRVLEGLQIGSEHFVARGYRSFNQDDGTEGSDALDVYLKQVDSNGYANAVDGADGLTSCYIRIDPDLGSMGGNMVESVAIHELHHCVQYSYTTETHSFLYESGATLEQYLALMDEGLEVALNVLYVERLTQPERRLNDKKGRFPYAAVVFMKFWEEYGVPDPGRVPALWEHLSQEPQWDDALRSESRRVWDTHFDEVFLDFARYNAFACSRDDGQHYDTESLGCTAIVEVPFESVLGPTGSTTVSLEEPRYTAAYTRWETATEGMASSLTCAAPSDPTGELRVVLAHVDMDGRLVASEAALVEEGGTTVALTQANGSGGSTLAVFASTGDGPVSATCVLDEVEVEELKNCGCTSSGLSSLAWWALPLVMIGRRRRSIR